MANRVNRLDYFRGMVKYHLLPEPQSSKIFIVGTGRSGTHWLGEIIGAHPNVVASVERAPIFDWVVQMALFPDRQASLLPKLAQRYRYEHAAVAPDHYLDKSHPNLWLADELSRIFPEARFLAIRRNVFATVSSMLRHKGVMRWIHEWSEFPLPNRFLGISTDTVVQYESLSLEGKCVARWKAHMQQIDRIGQSLGDRLLTVDYETLQTDICAQVVHIGDFLGLPDIPTPQIKTGSLERWRNELTDEQQRNIRAAVENFPAYAG